MQTNLDCLSSQHSKAKKEIATQNKKIDSAQKTIDKMESDHIELEKRFLESQKENEAFKEFINGEIDSEAVSAELEAKRKEIEVLQSSLP